MRLKYFIIRIVLLSVSVLLPLHVFGFESANLLQVYEQALRSDPTFKKANADWESAKQNLPIARAAYLTQIALNGNLQRQYFNASPIVITQPQGNGYNYDYGFVLTATQPIFNLPAWDAIKSARASVKSATATFSSAGQDLMLRTVQAYVAVLQAYDQLRFQLAQKRAIYEQLKVATEQFKVGLIAITGVYDARASYDQADATAIANQQQLDNSVEKLAEVTGIHYVRLYGIAERVPLIAPQPNDINIWSDVAERQNYSLIAQTYQIIAARETLKQQSTSWLPQVNLAGQYTNNTQTTLHEERFTIPQTNSNQVVYGLSVDFPVIQGGLVTAKTRQARYNYLSASDQREFIYRSVLSNTRQTFLGVTTGISKVKADRQSVASAQNSFNSTKVGYEVGTRTMVDILLALSQLYQAQQQYANDQYQYIVNNIQLKYYAGTLSVDDLRTINSWLKKDIKLNLTKTTLQSLHSRPQPVKTFCRPPMIKKTIDNTLSVAKRADVGVVKKPIIHASYKKPTQEATFPAPMALARTAIDLPAPQQTRPLSVASHQSSVSKKTTLHKTVSLDDQIIPLYEVPKERALPMPG